jgi:predicted MFS family arabinose efflux permease
MAAVFYQAAFAALTRWYGPHRVGALTALTLVAGLVSTIFAPLTSQLLQHLDWRATYLALAVLLAAVTVPLHAFALTPPWTSPRTEAGSASPAHRGVPPEVRTSGFLLLSGALTLAAFGQYAASLTLIPLLGERGFSATLAATTLGLLGAGQLLGRIAYAPLSARTSPTGRTVTILLGSAAAIGLLAALPGPASLLVVVAVLVGAARGAGTLLQATIVADRWGAARYGTLSGFFAAPITAAAAVAPWAGTALAEMTGSHPTTFWLLAGLVLLAAGAASVSARL